eukprot:PhF_6_TR40378/c0_g1_i1/m.60127
MNLSRIHSFVEELRASAQLPPEAIQGSLNHLRSALDSLDIVTLHSGDKDSLRSFGCSLWNHSSTSSTINVLTNMSPEQKAQMRSCACDMYFLGSDPSNLKTTIELVKMFTKTGRDWSDSGSNQNAILWLRRAHDLSLQLPHFSQPNLDFTTCGKLTAAVGDLHSCSLAAFAKAKEYNLLVQYLTPSTDNAMIPTLYASKLGFQLLDIVTSSFTKEQTATAEKLLVLMLQHLKGCGNVSDEDDSFWQCVTKCNVALSRYHYELGHHDSAHKCLIDALNIRPSIHVQVAMCTFLIQVEKWTEVKEQLDVLVNSPQCTVGTVLPICQSWIAAGHGDDAITTLLQLLERSHEDGEGPKAYLQVLQLLLAREDFAKAAKIMKDVHAKHGTNALVSKEIRERLVLQSWEVSSKLTSSRRWSEGIEWLNYGVMWSQGCNEHDRAKLFRALARSYMELQDFVQAAAAVRESLALEPRSVHSLYMGLQISIDTGDYGNAEKMLEGMADGEPQNLAPHVFALSAQFCHGKGVMSLTCSALEKLLGFSVIDGPLLRKRFVLLRNFVLCLDSLGGDVSAKTRWAITLFLETFEQQTKAAYSSTQPAVLTVDELCWWHLKAHSNGTSAFEQGKFRLASEMYGYATRISQLLLPNVLGAALFLLSLSGELSSAQREFLTLVTPSYGKQLLLKIAEGRLLFHKHQHAAASVPAGLQAFSARQAVLLCVGEISCSVAVGIEESELLSFLQSLRGQGQQVTSEDFEHIGAVIIAKTSVDGSQAKYRNALRFCVQCAIQLCEGTNLVRRVRMYRVLLEYCPSREDQLELLQRIRSEVYQDNSSSVTSSIPAEETKWLVVETWNAGTQIWHLNEKERAEVLLSLACEFATYLPPQDHLHAVLLPQYQAALQSMRAR